MVSVGTRSPPTAAPSSHAAPRLRGSVQRPARAAETGSFATRTPPPDRVALVTGSSRGLGSVIAARLGRDGFAVAVKGMHGDGHAEVVARAIRDAGGSADVFPGDVTDEPQVTDLFAAISERFGFVDTLVLNATGTQPDAAVEDADWNVQLAQLDYFVKSPVLLGRAALGGMCAKGYGRIIHIDSEVADRPPVGRSSYAVPRTHRSASPAAGHMSWRHSGSPSTPSRQGSFRSSGTPTRRRRSAMPSSHGAGRADRDTAGRGVRRERAGLDRGRIHHGPADTRRRGPLPRRLIRRRPRAQASPSWTATTRSRRTERPCAARWIEGGRCPVECAAPLSRHASTPMGAPIELRSRAPLGRQSVDVSLRRTAQ